jgi:predicted NBD/HSP70 family sugar kinase
MEKKLERYDGFYQKIIKSNNRKKIFNLLRNERKLTKQEISTMLSISITTVSSNIKALLKNGFVRESGFEESTGGRKATIIEFIPNSRYTIGVEFHENTGRIVLTNLDHEILKEKILDELDLSNLVDEIIKHINGFLDKMIDREKIIGVGISLPGTVNVNDKILEHAPNMNISNVDFNKVETMLGMPVFVDNEANCSAYGEYKLRDITKGAVFYVSITEGIGGAIIIDKDLYSGKNHRAGEIGHMTINFDGERCSCGNKGCWELYSSENSLKKKYKEITGKIPSTIGEIFSQYHANDRVKKMIKEYALSISIGIRNLLMIFDPKFIIIGGNISHYNDILLPLIKDNVFSDNHFFDESDLEIVFSQLGGDSGIIGATMFPIDSLF